MLLENVTSGSIQKLTVEMLTEGNMMDCKVIHAATSDSGFGCTRRFRGWTLGLHCAFINLALACLFQTLYRASENQCTGARL